MTARAREGYGVARGCKSAEGKMIAAKSARESDQPAINHCQAGTCASWWPILGERYANNWTACSALSGCAPFGERTRETAPQDPRGRKKQAILQTETTQGQVSFELGQRIQRLCFGVACSTCDGHAWHAFRLLLVGEHKLIKLQRRNIRVV